MAPWDFLFDESSWAVGKNGVSPVQTMGAYLGGSAIQVIIRARSLLAFLTQSRPVTNANALLFFSSYPISNTRPITSVNAPSFLHRRPSETTR